MAVKRKQRPRDPIQLAKLIGDIATGQTEDSEPDDRNPAAVELGRLGGLKGGPVRARKLAPAARRKIAETGGKARWKKQEEKTR